MPIESGAFWSAYWAMMLFALGGSMWAELGALIAASVIVLVALVLCARSSLSPENFSHLF